MEANFTLWPVGQGLFYSGSIDENKFNFIYDCGSSSIDISRIVDKFIENSSTSVIDMLVISHFDKDHVSGLPYLLNKIEKVRKIFIPYYGDFDSYLLLLYCIFENELGEEFEKKIDEIVLVNTKREGNADEQYIDYEELASLEINSKFSFPDIRIKELNKQGVTYNRRWNFKFYNAPLKGDKTHDEIKNKIDKLIDDMGCSNLQALLKMEEARKKLKEIYEDFCSSNQSSLCLYHSPSGQNEKCVFISLSSLSLINCITKVDLYERYFCHICRNCSCDGGFYHDVHAGTMLTGDISLKSKTDYESFKNFYQTEIGKTLFFLLPHHGSQQNWNEKILEEFNSVQYYINSSGLGNSYRHPNTLIVKTILNADKALYCSNETQLVEYFIDDFR